MVNFLGPSKRPSKGFSLIGKLFEQPATIFFVDNRENPRRASIDLVNLEGHASVCGGFDILRGIACHSTRLRAKLCKQFKCISQRCPRRESNPAT
jgi:hypothetical protein